MAKRSEFKKASKSVAVLHLDSKNPRLGRQRQSSSQKKIIQYLFEHDRAIEVAESIALLGYYPIESLLVVKIQGELVVVEGNRRLAALKGLHNPEILDPPLRAKIQSLRNRMRDSSILTSVPVVIAPNRRATDRTVAGRHISHSSKPWQAEDRASFIMEKLDEGYTVDQLRDELNFTLSDIQKAKQTKSIADISRALPLADEEAKTAIAAERPGMFSTIERVFDSTYARKKLFIEPDTSHGFVVKTSKPQIEKALVKLVTDIAKGIENSRTLNNEQAIKEYFDKRWKKDELPQKKQRTTTPADLVGTGAKTDVKWVPPKKPKPQARTSNYVIPKNFKPRYGGKRVRAIAEELCRMKRVDYPNGGAVLLRVFLELAIRDYLTRTGAYDALCKRLEKLGKLPFGHPRMKDIVTEVLKSIELRLPKHEADLAAKAMQPNSKARFSISELHSFVHSPKDMPTAHDLEQFWERVSAAMEMLLIDDLPEAAS